MIKKILIYIITGMICGAAAGITCSIFCLLTTVADGIKMEHTFLLYFLPLSGIIIVFLYRKYDRENICTPDEVIIAAKEGRKTPLAMIPLICVSTTLGYLTGGSLGRVGPSFQIGGGTTLQLAESFEARSNSKTESAPDLTSEFSTESNFDSDFNTEHDSDSDFSTEHYFDSEFSTESNFDSTPDLEARTEIKDRSNSKTVSNSIPGLILWFRTKLKKYGISTELLGVCGISTAFTVILNAPIAGIAAGLELIMVSLSKRAQETGNEAALESVTKPSGKQSQETVTDRLLQRSDETEEVPSGKHPKKSEMPAGKKKTSQNRNIWYLMAASAASTATGIVITKLLIFFVPNFSYVRFYYDPNENLTKVRPIVAAQVILLAILTTLVARMFLYSCEYADKAFKKIFSNEYIRVAVGTVLIVILVKISGTMDYSSIGLDKAAEALSGEADKFAFLWKTILTALTLGCGIRGGKVAPAIFIGAAFGCAFGEILGFDPSLCAAIGIVGTLSSAMNCTITVFLLGLETISFAPAMCLYFAITCVITHVLSGTKGIFNAQGAENIKFKIKIP